MPHAKRHDPIPVNPTYAGIYAHGVAVPPQSQTLHISGQVGVAPNGDLADDFDGQFVQAIENLRAVLASADMDNTDIVKMTIFLVSASDIPKAVKIRQNFFDGVRPAITTVIVSALVAPEWRVEIEATAAKEVLPAPDIPYGRWV